MININAQFHFGQLYSLEAQRQKDFKYSCSFYKQFTSLFETWLCHRPLALRGHVTSFLWKWKLHDFASETLLENWYWSFEICSRGSRIFWSVEEFFHRSSFFFWPVENFLHRSIIFLSIENFLHRSRNVFVGRECFGRSRIIVPVENFFGRSRIVLLVEKFLADRECF